MRTLIILRRVSLLILLVFLFGACKHDLVSETTLNYNEKKNAADYDDFILPPETVTASSGESRCIKLSWTAVENAVRYQIFSAETPFDVFTKVIETKDAETSVVLDEFAGITKYYTVCAVNYYGSLSAQSCVAQGSTIAVPIITGIDASEDGSSVTVSWWMDNCFQNTYQNDILFNIYVYKAGAPTVVLQKLQAQADERTLTINGLSSMTEYEFIVEAERKDNSAKETGSRTSAETAHRIIPDAPLNFTVEQGQSTTDISLSWELPSGSWYKENSGESGFVLHPLYFKVFRKESGTDEDFKEILSLSAENSKTWKFLTKSSTFFNCKDSSVKNKAGEDASAYLTIEVPSSVNSELLAPVDPYDTYIPGTKIIYKDTNVSRGKKYEYYVQSITDDTPNGKVITAKSSTVEPLSGWTIAGGIFTIKKEYKVSSENQDIYESIILGLKLDFQNYDMSYDFILEQTKFAVDDNNEENPITSYTKYESLQDFNAARINFNNPSLEIGKYYYKVYICPKNTTDIATAVADAYECFVCSNNKRLFVTDDATAIPVIENFTLVDGYKDYFKLSWTYNPDYDYFISYTDILSDGTAGEIKEEEISAANECFINKSFGDTIIYRHPANSGIRRIYTMKAVFGKESEDTNPNGDTEPKTYSTLGTPQPAIVSYDYNKILVTWPVVQKAVEGEQGYVITARYKNEQENQNLVTDENTVVTVEGEKVTCTINAPQGYNNALLSGKLIDFKVQAISTAVQEDEEDYKYSNTSDAIIPVCTVGPALIGTKVGAIQYDRINISWNKVQGAQGYLIHRLRYIDGRCSSIADSGGEDTYYFDGDTLKCKGDIVPQNMAFVTSTGNMFTLNDRYCESTDNTNPYQKNQSIIGWGIPFGYIVVPVKQGGSAAEDFILDGSNVSLAYETPIPYENILSIQATSATYGYGHKVHAQKSMSGSLQTVSWEAPYYTEENENEITPSVYYRVYGENTSWSLVKEVQTWSNNKQTISFYPDKNEMKTNLAYEYLVAYKQSANAMSNADIPSSFKEDSVCGLNYDETDYDYVTLGKNTEKANKGYLLCVDYEPRKFNPDEYPEDFSEIIHWDEWDYTKRSIGPDRAVLYIRNYNLSADWVPFANLDSNMHFTDVAPGLVNTTVEKNENSDIEIKIKPTTLMDGSLANPVTSGPLQVLRDAKHYYSLELVRGDDSYVIGGDGSKYTYRNINDYELAKITMLVFSDGMRQIGKLSFDNPIEKGDGASGGKIEADHEGKTSKTYNYKFINYAPKLEIPAGDKVSLITINTEKKNCYRFLGTQGGWPKTFDSVYINVKSNDILMPSSYNEEITFALSSHGNATIKANTTTIIMNNDELRRVFVPFKVSLEQTIFSETTDAAYTKDPTYGWWVQEGN